MPRKPIYRPGDWNDLNPRPFYRALKWLIDTDPTTCHLCATAMQLHADTHPRDTKWANLAALLSGKPFDLDPVRLGIWGTLARFSLRHDRYV